VASDPNPYEPPQAQVADTANSSGRPALVWVIVIFQAIGIIGGLSSTIAALVGHPFGGDAVRPYYEQLTVVDHIVTLIATVLSLFATVSLFQLKRRSLYLFVAVLVLGIANVGVSLAFRPTYRAMFEASGYWSLLLGWGIGVAILLYVWRLHAKGVLRA